MIIPRRRPPVDDEPDYSRVFYCDPPSHDFLSFCIMSKMNLIYSGNPNRLRIKFGLIEDQLGLVDYGHRSPWHDKPYGCGVPKGYSTQMISYVLRPAIDMIGAVEEPYIRAPFKRELIANYCEYDYHISNLVDASRAGYKLPQFKPPQWAHDEVKKFLGNRNPIIITLRETCAQPERNSLIDEWLRFAESVQGEHEVLFLRDTANAHDEFPFPTWPKASRDAYVRAALYQRALVNMFTSNGPQEWCMFTDAPYLTFKQLVPSLTNWQQGQPIGWREGAHLEVGEQWPWALPTQRLTWTEDTFENIRSEFERFMGLALVTRARAAA